MQGSSPEIDEAMALIGRPLRVERWNTAATPDAIRHYAWGIGDDNPLFCDEAYGARTRWGSVIAPPTFLWSVYDGVVAPGLENHTLFYAGADWTFDRPVRAGEPVQAAARVSGLRAAGGRVQGMMLQSGTTDYADAAGARVARLVAHLFRVPVKGPVDGPAMPFKARAEHVYTDAEFARIEAMVLDEFVRGSARLEWGDVVVGEAIPTIARGPMCLMDMMAYYAGAVGNAGYKSTKLRLKYRAWGLHDPDRLPSTLAPSYFAANRNASGGHFDAAAAERAGMPGVYDNGLQRIGFMTTAVTNWMGDDARLEALSVKIKSPVIFGDTTFAKGEVTGRSEDGDARRVELAIRAENQLGEVTASGTCTVRLAD